MVKIVSVSVLKRKLAALGLSSVLLSSRHASAFDASGVASAAAGMAASYFSGGLMGGGGFDMEEMAGFAIAFTELLEEFDIDTDADDDIKDMSDKLEALESRGREFEGQLKSMGPLSKDIAKAKDLKTKIQRIRDMVKMTKTIAGLMKAMPKGGERALKVQDTRLNYMILDELMKISRAIYSEKLEKKMRAAKYELLLNELKRDI
jgi:hypothetical protein